MTITIDKGRQYDANGYSASTHDKMWDGKKMNSSDEIIIDGGRAPLCLAGFDRKPELVEQFFAAARRVMETGVSETIEIDEASRKPMTDAENDAFDASRDAIESAMTLGGTTY